MSGQSLTLISGLFSSLEDKAGSFGRIQREPALQHNGSRYVLDSLAYAYPLTTMQCSLVSSTTSILQRAFSFEMRHACCVNS